MTTTNGPQASTLTFLNLLHSSPRGTKVRFLGCVTRYNVRAGVLELRHEHHPSFSSLTQRLEVVALVDINVIKETMSRNAFDVGEWVNVVGYVADSVEVPQTKADGWTTYERKKKASGTLRVGKVIEARIDAIVVWNTGVLRLGDYESALEARLQVKQV